MLIEVVDLGGSRTIMGARILMDKLLDDYWTIALVLHSEKKGKEGKCSEIHPVGLDSRKMLKMRLKRVQKNDSSSWIPNPFCC